MGEQAHCFDHMKQKNIDVEIAITCRRSNTYKQIQPVGKKIGKNKNQ